MPLGYPERCNGQRRVMRSVILEIVVQLGSLLKPSLKTLAGFGALQTVRCDLLARNLYSISGFAPGELEFILNL